MKKKSKEIIDNKIVSSAERKIIKAKLKFGDVMLIARLSGKSRVTVARWFNNEGDCYEIPEAIDKLYKNRQKTIESFKNTLNSIGK